MSFDVTLSFDNGPEPEVTPGVLDTLARQDLRASFFVLGRKLALPGRRDLAVRAKAEGHWIANHTYSHETPLGLLDGNDVAEREIGRTQALIGDLAHPDRFFRPFGGQGRIGPHLLSPAVVEYLKSGGYSCVIWNSIPRDWENIENWPEVALAQCRRQPWSLVVVHDVKPAPMAQLGRFIELVRGAGGRFRQDFPPDCMPIFRGQEAMPLAPYVAEVA